jgi:hypothetical protein
MRWLGGGRVLIPYNEDFFFWWPWQVIELEDYPYAGIDFRGDPNIPLQLGSTYGDIGMTNFLNISFFCIFV